MSLKNLFLRTKWSYKIYLYYNLYVRNKALKKRDYYSQWGEDLEINNYFNNINKGFYLDIGCFHPVKYNNTFLLYKKGWNGINIDLNQSSIDLFNIIRPRDKNICAVLSNSEKKVIINFDDPFSPLNTINEDFLEVARQKSSYFSKLTKIKAEAKNPNIFLSEVKQIDFINIDSEGEDFNILNEIDLKKYRTKLVAIETHEVDDSKGKDCDKITNLLTSKGFKFLKRFKATSLFSKIS
tara:strand:- start:115 stop:828 length:714 start_codon:yes stop_codon:yes gene_type:complete